MPRGLGDNPLKREKKLRHSSSRASRPNAPLAEQASPLPPGPGEVHASSSVRSYNDVFFQRRPEAPASAPTSVPEGARVETQVVNNPEPVAESLPSAVDVPAVPAEETPHPAELTAPVEVAVPVEALAHPVEEVAHPVEVHAEQVPSAVEQHAETTAPMSAEVQVTAATAEAPTPAAPPIETAPESSERKGLFGRFFGKWRKS